MKKAKGTVLSKYLIEDVIQRIMHSSVKMKSKFSFSFVAIFFCLNV